MRLPMRAFTLIELLLVISIIAVMIAILVPVFTTITNQVRMPTESEAVDAARLIDALTAGTGAFGGAVPVYLPGVDPRLQTFRQEICAVTYTRRLGGKLTALDRGETLLALGRAVWFTMDNTMRDAAR